MLFYKTRQRLAEAGCRYTCLMVTCAMSCLSATDKVGVIVGAVFGALLLLLLLLFLIWVLICCCQKKRYQKEAANEIRYCIRVGDYFMPGGRGISECPTKTFFFSFILGRMSQPQRADPPADTPASTQ